MGHSRSKKRRVLHEALSGRRLTKLEYEHELPKLQDQLLDAQFELRKSSARGVAMIVTGIPAAGRSEVVNELLGLARSQVRHRLRLPRAERGRARASAAVALLAGDAAERPTRHPARRLVRRLPRRLGPGAGARGRGGASRRGPPATPRAHAGRGWRHGREDPSARRPRGAAPSPESAGEGQDHALARHRRGPLVCPSLRTGRTGVRALPGID